MSPPTLAQKIEYLTHLSYVHSAEAVRRTGINISTAKNIKDQAGALCVKHIELGLPPPSLEQQVTRKVGSGAKPKTSVGEVTTLLESCTLNKKQRKKLWHVVAKEDGFFDYHRRTIEKKLRQQGLRSAKSTKKLGLTDIQRTQCYEIALS